MSYAEKTCGDCLHWHEGPPDPTRLGARAGECRLQLVAVAVPRRTVRGVEAELVSSYPVVPPEFRACSHHTPRAADGG